MPLGAGGAETVAGQPGRYAEGMNTLIYLLTAVLMGVLGVRTWRGDPADPTRQAYAGLAAALGTSNLCFALYLATELELLRHLHLLSGALVPAAALTLLHRLLGGGPRSAEGRRLWQISGALVATAAPLFIALPLLWEAPPLQIVESVLSVWVFVGLGACLRWLWERYRTAEDGVQQKRIFYLMALMGAGVSASLLEGLVRVSGRLLELGPSALQGALPPLGAALGAALLYVLHHVVELYRLIDVQEMVARSVSLVTAALMLVASKVVIDNLSDTPVHGDFQFFLVAVVFLSIYAELREQLDALISQRLNRQGRRLMVTFREVDRALAKVITLQDLESELLGRLHASGRVPMSSLYLWDQGVFRLTLERGTPARPLMRTIADRPFTDGFRAGERLYTLDGLRRAVERRQDGHEDAAGRLRTLEAMDAELVLPIMSGELVLGWLGLRGDELAGGFTSEETRRLQSLVDRTAVVLDNLRGFDQLKEQHRLAALGTMSAGLAHEIRNPLAGIKGAAQYLQGDVTREELGDFVSLIVQETDRLNEVVSQFLAYARPFEVHTEPADLNELVERALSLVLAEGHPSSVHIETDLSAALPAALLDRDRLLQVLLNLLHNALHAIDGSGTLTLTTGRSHLRQRAGRGRPAVEIRISDDGPGILPEDLEKLFIPFFTTKPRGTGLGLAISLRLIEAHGGEIDVQSKPGQGSTFTIRIPLPAESTAQLPPPEPDGSTEELPRPLQRLRMRIPR